MSQVNHNYSYVYEVDGHTVWERLRVIRGFLMERRKALRLAEMKRRKFEEVKHSMDKWEREEASIMREDEESLIQDCKDEINFLENFEKELTELAEKERITGKTDREMYELNFAKEARVRLAFRANSEVIATGSVSPETMRSILRDDNVKQLLLEQGVINEGSLKILDRSTFLLGDTQSKKAVG